MKTVKLLRIDRTCPECFRNALMEVTDEEGTYVQCKCGEILEWV